MNISSNCLAENVQCQDAYEILVEILLLLKE